MIVIRRLLPEIDITSKVPVLARFPGIWGFPSVSMYALITKVFGLWGSEIDTEDKFWPHFYAVSDEGDYRRLLNRLDDLVSVVGNPARALDAIGADLAIRLTYSATCQTEGVYITDYVLSDVDVYWRVLGVKGWYLDRSQRVTDLNDMYFFNFDTLGSATDFGILKSEAGTWTTLAQEAVDLSSTTIYSLRSTIVGSTLEFYRDGVLKLTATDTTFASGVAGLGKHNVDLRYSRIYRKPYGTLAGELPGVMILESEMRMGVENQMEPSLLSNLIEISETMDLPEFLKQEKERYDQLRAKGMTDEEMYASLGYIPQHQVDINSVTWGGFEISPESPTNIIVVYGDNPYKPGAVERQEEFVKSRGLKAIRPSRGDYRDVVDVYMELRREFKDWIAGKDNFAYQVLGWRILYILQNVDFYYGELIEHRTHYNQLKQVPEHEIRRRLDALEEELSRVEVLTEERDKHLGKIREIKRIGW